MDNLDAIGYVPAKDRDWRIRASLQMDGITQKTKGYPICYWTRWYLMTGEFTTAEAVKVAAIKLKLDPNMSPKNIIQEYERRSKDGHI